MLKKMLAFVFIGLLVLGGYGCGGGGGEDAEDAAQIDPSSDPALVEAVKAQQSGQQLTGKQERLLEEARDAGVID